MAVVVERITPFAWSGDSPQSVALGYTTTAGRTLLVLMECDRAVTVTGTGCTFTRSVSAAVNGVIHVSVAWNMTGGATALSMAAGAYDNGFGYILELSGTVSDANPLTHSATRANAYNTTNLGCGSITIGAGDAGMAFAFFGDNAEVMTSCVAQGGAGFTAGTFANNSNWMYRTTVGSGTYGGATSGVATGAGSGLTVDAVIVNIKAAAAAAAGNPYYAYAQQ